MDEEVCSTRKSGQCPKVIVIRLPVKIAGSARTEANIAVVAASAAADI